MTSSLFRGFIVLSLLAWSSSMLIFAQEESVDNYVEINMDNYGISDNAGSLDLGAPELVLFKSAEEALSEDLVKENYVKINADGYGIADAAGEDLELMQDEAWFFSSAPEQINGDDLVIHYEEHYDADMPVEDEVVDSLVEEAKGELFNSAEVISPIDQALQENRELIKKVEILKKGNAWIEKAIQAHLSGGSDFEVEQLTLFPAFLPETGAEL